MSYQDFLPKRAKLLPESLPFFAGTGFRNNMRADTCPAYTAARSGRTARCRSAWSVAGSPEVRQRLARQSGRPLTESVPRLVPVK